MHFSPHTPSGIVRLVLTIAFAFAFALPPAEAQTVGTIRIGGKVFGGGLQGQIGTANPVNTEKASVVTIKGGDLNDVYGGGEKGNSKGQTNVILQGGTVSGSVFGGARMADVDGQTHVNIDGANATNDLIVGNVFGGNDISGNITGTALVESTYADDTADDAKRIYVTNLFGGGNGDYDYASNIVDGNEQNPYAGLSKPEIANVRIDLHSGCYFQVFGGGNAATVTSQTTITLDNSTTKLFDAQSNPLTYQFERVFGGNNKEPMAIRPTWDLQKAWVNNLYSGGNAGAMTYYSIADAASPKGGIILALESDDMHVNNVYGGCRMADVNPGGYKGNTEYAISAETFLGQPFKQGYAARVLIKGGDINNVYGGNDVSGVVYYGSQIEILSSINGDVYGAGNGSYAYTDNPALKNDPVYGDFYYDGASGGLASAQALNRHRPNVEKSYVHLAGDTDKFKNIFIGGAVYCGGNSATLRAKDGSLAKANSELHIGSYVIADNVFLGSNGANMVVSATPTDVLQIIKNGPMGYNAGISGKYSSLDLTQNDQFEEYMRGVEVNILPKVSFDADYVDHSTKFGSMYCGGNVGSMSASGLFTADYLNNIIIYNKLVGGSNNANVAKTVYNAFHLGGVIGAPDANGNKVQLNVAGLQLEPHVLTRNPFSLSAFSITGAPESPMLTGGNIYGGCYSSGYINGNVTINITENAISDMVAGSGVPYETIQNDVLASTLSVYGGGYGQETEIWGDTHINITDNGQIMKAYGGGEMGVVGKLQRDADGHYLTEEVQEWFSVTTRQNLHGYETPVTDYSSRPHTVARFASDDIHDAIVTLNANLLPNDLLNVAKLYGGGFQGTVSGNTIVNLNRGRVYDAFGGASNADILGHTEMYVGKGSAPTVAHNVYGANDFGGLIVGKGVFYVDNNKDGDHDDTMEKILSQTYVEYSSGNIAGDLFGGPCGAYEYTDDKYADIVVANYYTLDEYKALTHNDALTAEEYENVPDALKAKPGFCRPQLLENLLTSPMLVPDPEGKREHVGYAANSFVNIISQSTLATDAIGGSIFGAGQGLKGAIKLADERGSYVRLMSATKAQRPVGELSHRVYGAGYCSNTNRSLVDAYTGYFGTLFGGAHGITYQELTDLNLHNPSGTYETNYMGYRAAVRLYDMDNNQMDLYGGGANAGAEETGVVLYGGQARNVYGASYAQGITYAASVEVPEASTTRVRAIFGGAEGGSDAYPCDAYNTFVTWKGVNARVQDAIYGGNNKFRMTRNSYLAINAPIKNFEEKLANVFGGGYGENTVTLYTSIGLQSGAEVANVFGGGNNGQVLDTPSFRYYLDDGNIACQDGHTKLPADNLKIYPTQLLGYGYQKYLNDSEVIGFHNWIVQHCWDGTTLDTRNQPLGSYTANAHGHAHPVYFLSTQMDDMKNTNVFIMKGARVAENAYGGGLGEKALVSGETAVHLWGGTVEGDIYGGGYGGHVEEYPHLIFPAGGQYELTLSSTHVDLQGGIARNVYGGGLNGRVTGSTDVVLGTKDQHPYDFYGTTVAGQYEHQIIYGDPIVERSLYGGGQMGPVVGTANVTINQGHVGYKYDATKEADNNVTININGSPTTVNLRSNAACYVENLDLNDEGDNFLDQNGNAFGAGYGEGASVDNTFVNIYGGTIRNSLYGGGEIAAVGQGTMKVESGATRVLDKINVPGRTHVYIYNGLIQGDVFGGGRGYSYDLTGNEVVGKALYTDGYVFGTTDVNIRGGIIGTPTTLAQGHGNVFGGGNIGYCYSDAHKDGKKGDGSGEGRYYANRYKCNKCNAIHLSTISPTTCPECKRATTGTDENYRTTFTPLATHVLSEDTRVIISPYAQVTAEGGVTINGTPFAKGEYIPTEALNSLNGNAAEWAKISLDGVNILNAVFAGGNVSAGSDKVYANAYTVFGNATASINDVFSRDLVTIGTDNIGGLYGDGNLTFVDGYRELNITNYGTDFYRQNGELDLATYNQLTNREKAYYVLEFKTTTAHDYSYYVCIKDGEYQGVVYPKGKHIDKATYDKMTDDEKAGWKSGLQKFTASSTIASDTYDMMTDDEKSQWQIKALSSTFAGRVLNTIQRADFCGVFGSRMVLQGAQDRVPEVVDYTHYTLNRVGEVSLNAKTVNGTKHGNYFGLFNVVNYLGALTSDVKFTDTRTTDNSDPSYAANGTSFYAWKVANQGNKKRNNGLCHNMVALASGVYLELVNEIGSTPEYKNYGPITGVVQLDLINVMPGLGGGYVYAKNIHGVRSEADAASGYHENLSSYNQDAVNNTKYTYTETPVDGREPIQTSGNFIHNVKQIVDDCFPGGGQYKNYDAAPAHYWYIRGEYYVYDQYVSAYTGSSNAYLENIDIPLTITAGAHGKLDLLDIKPNYYAYYYDEAQSTKLGDAGSNLIVLNGNTYGLNDVITWWDYMQLSEQQKKHFVPETYVATKDYCLTDGGPVIAKGEVILPTGTDGYNAIKDEMVYDPNDFTTDTYGATHMKKIRLGEIFHISNAISHENGYVLTVDMTNPLDWDKWYSPTTGAIKLNGTDYSSVGTAASTYKAGPTYYTNDPGVYGQRYYHIDDIITDYIKTAYLAIPETDMNSLLADTTRPQAQIAQAYVSITAVEYDITDAEGTHHKKVQEGVGISATEYALLDATTKAKFAKAYTCTSTYEVDKENNEYIYHAELVPESRYDQIYNSLVTKHETAGKSHDDAVKMAEQTMSDHFDNANMVITEGWYGGQHFADNQNYRVLDTWASLSQKDRSHFQFRNDALDAILLSDYPGLNAPGSMTQYDGNYWEGSNGFDQKQVYGATQPIDYLATYNGTSPLTYKDASGVEQTIAVGTPPINREDFERLPNEQHHYSSVNGEAGQTSHIVKEGFEFGGKFYSAGQTVTDELYNNVKDANKFVDFTPTADGTYYFCRSAYNVGENGEGKALTTIGGTTIGVNQPVPVGTIISADAYAGLPNCQQDFVVHGNSPIETSTFYVAADSDIDDLSKDRVITVIYQYKYEESDAANHNIEEIIERHVINIHIVFKTGVPTVGQLQPPSIVLPGETVGLKTPSVSEGAYTILGGGWELYTNAADAEKHENGVNYTNNATPMYWYQDGYYVAYFAKTYLGKTYSNAVQFKVANYHDIADVMADTDNFMFVDHPDVHRDSKIYINNSYTDEHPEATKSEIDMLYDLFHESLATTTKVIQVDVQDKDGDLPLYYVVEDGKPTAKTTTDPKEADRAFPVTHKEDRTVPKFNEHARNCENLEFHITSDVATKKPSWQPIGSLPPVDKDDKDYCFRGNVHGHGMTISGLDHSLFENLCGSVYNLGVTGSFSESGVANKVSLYKNEWDPAEPQGMAQNCWIHTTGTPTNGVLPVIGVKNELKGISDPSGMHTFNCYFPVEDGYNFTVSQPYEAATPRPMSDFRNGSVAFDLNGFYLHKRYADQRVSKWEAESTLTKGGSIYYYWVENADGSLKATPNEGYYNQGANHKYGIDYYGYVENIYADGDFVYAMGEIPTTTNERFYSPHSRYLPIWPDDYIFFGQMLTYGYDENNRPYQPLPSASTKTDDIDHRLITTDKTNVVFRAPAYYRSSKKSVVHFNPGAVFADHVKDQPTQKVNAGLTAIDFTGLNDVIRQNGGVFENIPVTQSYYNGPRDGINFPPVLNFTTLLSFETHDITQNLLAYAPDPNIHEGTKRTNEILTAYFNEPAFAQHYDALSGRRTVESLSTSTISGIHGHVVQKNGTYMAHTDHFLVDRQDFNAPISYRLAPEKRMWYQRAPKSDQNPDGTLLYADLYRGWEGVSLPFSAELVSTQTKGEITHFYNTAIDAAYAPGYTSGHEYWLREFTGTTTRTAEEDGQPVVLATAQMHYPVAVAGSKTVSNTFLWDYYYNADGTDLNGDDYRHDPNNEDADTQMGRRYYSMDRTYDNYPLSQPGRPYIVGFPGSRYYEFDLSGTFVPEHSGAVTPSKLDPQTISFVSAPAITISVSDDEMEMQYADNTHDGYMFAPSYLNTEAPASGEITDVDEFNAFFGTTYTAAEFASLTTDERSNFYYTLNTTGSAFDKTTEPTIVGAFRPYFLVVGSQQLKAPATRSISFGSATDAQFEPDDDTLDSAANHGLRIYAKKGKIVVESTLEGPKDVRITTTAGQVITTFTIEPGERITTRTALPGVYVVNTTKVLVE